VNEQVLSDMERDGLTMWGDSISAQFRDEGQLALNIMDGAPRDVDGVVLLTPGDVSKLAELIEEAESRG
jgi:hypothetical protein